MLSSALAHSRVRDHLGLSLIAVGFISATIWSHTNEWTLSKSVEDSEVRPESISNTTPRPTTGATSLPFEVLSRIMQFALEPYLESSHWIEDNEELLRSLALVSRMWHAVALQERVVSPLFTSLEQLRGFLAHAERAEKGYGVEEINFDGTDVGPNQDTSRPRIRGRLPVGMELYWAVQRSSHISDASLRARAAQLCPRARTLRLRGLDTRTLKKSQPKPYLHILASLPVELMVFKHCTLSIFATPDVFPSTLHALHLNYSRISATTTVYAEGCLPLFPLRFLVHLSCRGVTFGTLPPRIALPHATVFDNITSLILDASSHTFANLIRGDYLPNLTIVELVERNAVRLDQEALDEEHDLPSCLRIRAILAKELYLGLPHIKVLVIPQTYAWEKIWTVVQRSFGGRDGVAIEWRAVPL